MSKSEITSLKNRISELENQLTLQEKPVFSTDEAAYILQISKQTLLSQVRQGRLPYVQISPQRYVFPRDELFNFLNLEARKNRMRASELAECRARAMEATVEKLYEKHKAANS